MDMVVLRIDKSFIEKVILVPLGIIIKGCLTLDLKGRISSPDLLDLCVVRSMRVGLLPVGIVSMDMVKVTT